MELEEILTMSNIMFVVGILGVIFSIYHYFKNPQLDIEKRQALDAQATEKDKLIAEKDLGTKATILAQKEAEGKASLLAQQVQWEKESNEKKFTEFGVRLDTALSLAQNHIHSVDVKVDNLVATVVTMNLSLTKEITKLGTIIEERNPKNS
jgi:hypothetical protein